MNNIICLDIDDCIFINENTWVGNSNDSLSVLEINLKRLLLILNKFNAKVFITSSWWSILILENNNIIYNNTSYGLPGKEYYEHEYNAFKILKKYLDGYIIGLSCGDRHKDITSLLKDNDNKIIALDDMDLSSIKDNNYLYLKTIGFLDNTILFNVNKFFSEIK